MTASPPPAARSAADPARTPWPDLDGLPGVAQAVDRARTAIAAVRRLPANRQGWARTSAAAAVRAARASAMLDGGSAALGAAATDDPATDHPATDGATFGGPDGSAAHDSAPYDGPKAPEDRPTVVTDPILAGALRATAAVGELAAVWRRAPLQALARLHTLAAADLVPDDALGRPRPDAGLGQRIAALAQVLAASPWSGPVTVAMVHGELLTLRPFGSGDGVVARAAGRLTMVTSGLDPQALTVPEVGHLRAGAGYLRAAEGYASGDPSGLADWIIHVCDALQAGAGEARSIARAAGG